jgi:hypothetical protein
MAFQGDPIRRPADPPGSRESSPLRWILLALLSGSLGLAWLATRSVSEASGRADSPGNSDRSTGEPTKAPRFRTATAAFATEAGADATTESSPSPVIARRLELAHFQLLVAARPCFMQRRSSRATTTPGERRPPALAAENAQEVVFGYTLRTGGSTQGPHDLKVHSTTIEDPLVRDCVVTRMQAARWQAASRSREELVVERDSFRLGDLVLAPSYLSFENER